MFPIDLVRAGVGEGCPAGRGEEEHEPARHPPPTQQEHIDADIDLNGLFADFTWGVHGTVSNTGMKLPKSCFCLRLLY